MAMRLQSVGLLMVLLTVFSVEAYCAEGSLRKTLEEAWNQYIKACQSGERAALEAAMSSFQYGSMMNSFTSAKRSLTREMIKDMAKRFPEKSKMQFVKLIANGPTAGMIYVSDSEEKDASNKPRVTFTFIKFVNEPSGWKVDGMMNVGDVKYQKDGKKTEFDSSNLPPMLAIDGKVREAPPSLLPPRVQGVLDVFSYGYTTAVTLNGIEQGTTKGASRSALVKGGLKKGKNEIEIFFARIADKTDSKPSVKIRVLTEEKKEIEIFKYEPEKTIEGKHTFSFDVNK